MVGNMHEIHRLRIAVGFLTGFVYVMELFFSAVTCGKWESVAAMKA